MNLMEYGSATLVLIIARFGGFLGTFPLFRSNMIPRSIKVSLTMAMSTMWMANFMTTNEVPLPGMLSDHPVAYTIAIARESMIGMMLGFLLGLVFIPAQLAGAYLGQEMGFNMAGMTDPSTGANSNVIGDFLGAMATLAFLLADAHHLAFGTVYWSFTQMPLGAALPHMSPDMFSQSFSDAHRWGIELAAPIGTGLFLTTVVTAMLMKISPQLNLFAVGIPMRLLLGISTSLLFFPDIVAVMESIFLRKLWIIQQLGI